MKRFLKNSWKWWNERRSWTKRWLVGGMIVTGLIVGLGMLGAKVATEKALAEKDAFINANAYRFANRYVYLFDTLSVLDQDSDIDRSLALYLEGYGKYTKAYTEAEANPYLFADEYALTYAKAFAEEDLFVTVYASVYADTYAEQYKTYADTYAKAFADAQALVNAQTDAKAIYNKAVTVDKLNASLELLTKGLLGVATILFFIIFTIGTGRLFHYLETSNTSLAFPKITAAQIKKAQLNLFKSLLPKEKKEEILGDLIEMAYYLKAEGKSPKMIKAILLYQKSVILLHFFFKRIKSIFSTQTKINKD